MVTHPYQEPRQPLRLPQTEILGSLELVTAPSGQIITTGVARDWLRVDQSLEDDEIARLVNTATDYCENQIHGHRQIRQATYDQPVACWWEGQLRIPRPPLQSITSIKYYDTDGTEQTLSSSVYNVRTPLRQPGTVERAANQTWPAYQQDRIMPITIRFVAGYTTVPSGILQAIRFLVAQWYTFRVPTVTQEMANTVRDLLDAEGYGSYA